MTLSIENAVREDIPAIAEIECSAFSDPWGIEGFYSELDRPMGIFLAAKLDGETAGYIIGDCDGISGYISNIACKEKFRRTGVGQALIKEFISRLSQGTESVVLEVRASNRAATGLYRKCGFKDIGVRRDFYENPREDAIVMMKML